MGVAGGIVSFVIIWWVVLFAVLPLKIRSVWQDEQDGHEIPKGADVGAPTDPRLFFKAKLTTGVTVVIWLVVFGVISFAPFSYDR